MVAMFATDWNEIINLNRGPSIDASNQVSIHLVKRFQMRRLKSEKLIDDGKSSYCLWQGELYGIRNVKKSSL